MDSGASLAFPPPLRLSREELVATVAALERAEAEAYPNAMKLPNRSLSSAAAHARATLGGSVRDGDFDLTIGDLSRG